MSDDKLTLALRLIAENSVYKRVLADSQTGMNRFVNKAKQDVASLGRAFNSFAGKAAAVGLGFGAFEIAKGAAVLDQHLTRIVLSAGKSKVEVKDLREQLQGLGIKTGQNVGELANGFERLFSLTGDWDTARKAIEAVNTAVTVTGANTDTLAESLAVAQTFGKNLSKPGVSSEVLNKLGAIAPGAGGLQNVAGIFNRISPMAKLAGMDFDSAITFIGEISKVTKNPDQMGEMAEQTLRMFTGLKGLTNTKGSLGQLMFDPKTGEKQNPLVVLSKVKTLYDSLSEKKRVDLMMQLGADPKSMKSAQMFLESIALTFGAEIKKNIASSANKYEQRMGEATADAAHQAARLKNLLTDAGEQFARPVNKALADLIKFGIDKGNLKYVGGAGLGAAGAAAMITTWTVSALLKEAFGKFLGGKESLASGVTEGGMLRQVGVTSVYVVNYGEIGNALGNSPAGKFQEFLPKVAAPVGAGAAGIGAGTLAATVGVVGLSVGALAVSIWAATQEKYRKMADQIRGSTNLQGGAVSGAGYNPDEFLHYKDTNLHQEINVTAIIDGEKKKPTKTIVDGRGHFKR